MRVTIDFETYRGVPGSSLSDFRCEQTVILHDFITSRAGMNYVQVQKEAADLHLFKSRSVLRTFCPLLANLHFVEYGNDENFRFTDDGILFVNAIKAIESCESIDSKTENDKKVLNNLYEIKKDLIRLGISNMYNDLELRNNNIWIAFSLLKNLDYLIWNEYFWGLHLIKEKLFSVEEACFSISKNRVEDIVYEAFNKNGEKIADTQWSYMRSLLYEADLIEDYKLGSRLNANGIKFLKDINYGEQ